MIAFNAILAFFLALRSCGAATPAAGSPSGFAMRIQGKGDFAAPKLKFSAGTVGAYPQSTAQSGGGGATISMWLKLFHPLGGGKRMFLLGEAETFKYCPFLNFKNGFNSSEGDDPSTTLVAEPIVLSHFVDELGTPTGTTGKTYADFFDTWVHVAVTTQGTAGNNFTEVKFYVNGVEVSTDTMSQEINWLDLPGFAVGQYAGFGDANFPKLNIVDDHTNGLMDEIAIYSRALTAAEILARKDVKLTGSETDLKMYWNFDDISEFAAGSVTNGAGNAQWDLRLGTSYNDQQYRYKAAASDSCRFDKDKSSHYCETMTKPQFVASNIPEFSAPTAGGYGANLFYAKVGSATFDFQLTGVDLDNAAATLAYAITAQPASGSISVVAGSGVATYTPPTTGTPSDQTFSYTVTTSDGGSVSSAVQNVIKFPAAPTTMDITVQPYEDMAAEIIMKSYDPSGLKNSFTVVTAPAGGKLYSLDGSGNVLAEITSVPATIETNRLKFRPDKDDVSTRTFTYTASNIFATSATSTATISITLHDDKPAPATSTVDGPASGLSEIDLAALVTDPDSSFFSVVVEELPINGKLYLANDATTAEVDKFDPFFAPLMTSQYVNKVLECSTHYRSGSGGWSAVAIVGPPDAPLAYGDSGNALCFMDKAAQSAPNLPRCGVTISTGTDATGNLLTKFDPDGTTYGGHFFGTGYSDPQDSCNRGGGIPGCTIAASDVPEITTECWDSNAIHAAYGYSQYFTVQFAEQVYMKSLRFGINRGAGSITDIEAYDRVTGTWQTIFKTAVTNDQAEFDKLTNQYNTFTPYPLCEPAFKTDIVRVKVDTITVDDWNEFDYIELTGSTVQSPGVITSGKVYYEAGADASCVDNFYFSATDCGGQATRSSAPQQFNVNPNGATGLPSCASPVAKEVSVLSTEFDPAEFNPAYLAATYDFSAVADASFNTWLYDATANKFIFNWAGTDSDKTTYDVLFNVMTKGTTDIVFIQTVTFSILDKFVFMTDDIEWDVSKCTSNNNVAIAYRMNTAKVDAIGGKSQPPDSTEPCADVPADSSYGVLVVILAVGGMIVCGLFVAFIVIKKSHPVIKSSQPLFCIVYGGGCSFICIQMLFYLGEATDFTCGMRYWLFNVIFTLSFGALFAKTWRVWRVFSNTHLKKIRLTNMDTLRVMFMLLLVEVVCLSLGQIFAPFKPTEETIEFEVGRSLTQVVCKSETSEWALLTMAYKVILVLIGCYLSWTTRNVDSAFAESKYIMLAIYQVAIYGLVAAIVNGSGSDVQMTLLVQTFCCVFGAIFCVASVLVPKILLIQSGQYDDGFKSGSQGTSLNTGAGSGNAEEMERLEVEIERLKGIITDAGMADEI